jgi:uncharacterized membrane protein YhaH (DUF805 family)
MSTPGPYGAYPSQPGQYAPGGYPAPARSYLEGGPVGFGDAIKQAFGHAFVYRGRASRSAYWWFALFDFIAIVVAEIVIFGLAAAIRTGAVSALLFIIFGIAVIYLALVGLSLTVRRLHDSDKTGWWVLISLVPFGGIVLLVFTLLEPTPGPNRYQP